MAYGNMTPATPGGVASAAANNQIIANVDDLDTRMDTQEATSSTNGTRITTLETKVGAAPNSPTIHTRLTALEAVSGTGTATVQSAPGNSGTVNITSYTETRTGAAGNEAGVAFVAPGSGKVKITWSVGITAPNTTAFALCSFVVRTTAVVGGGSTVQASSDNVTCQNTGNNAENTYSNFYLLEGLTPGADYNIRLSYRVSTGTGTFNRPKVLVEPVLA